MRGKITLFLGFILLSGSSLAAWAQTAQPVADGVPESLVAPASPQTVPQAAAAPSVPSPTPAATEKAVDAAKETQLHPVAAKSDAPIAANAIQLRAGVHPDYDRIVFDWPRTTSYKISRAGDRVTVHFDGAATLKPAGMNYLTRLRGFASTTDSDGHLSVSFTVAANATVKDFTSDKSVAIDVQGPVLAAPAAEAAKPAPKVEVKAEPKPAPKIEVKPETPKLEAAVPVKDVAKEPPKETASPAKDAAKDASKDAPKDIAKSGPVVSVPTVAAPKPEPISIVPPIVMPAPSVAPVTPVASVNTSAAMPVPVKAIAVVAQAPASPADKALDDLAASLGDAPTQVLALDTRIPVRIAAWTRGGYVTVIFDRKLTFDLNALTAGQPAPRVTAVPVDLLKASGVRFAVPRDTEMTAALDGNVWRFYLSNQQSEAPTSRNLVAQPDFALGARFMLPMSDPPDPVRLTDPVVGDDLIVIPTNPGEAFSLKHRMADFVIVPANQGLVMKPLVDKFVARTVADGIEITSEGGLHLSNAVDTGALLLSSQHTKSLASGKSIFDFNNWRGKPGENFTKTRQRLQQTIIDVPERERNRARLELGRFYFANGNGEEAQAMFTYLAKQLPDLVAHSDFLALSGAAKILAYHPEDGLKDLSAPVLAGQPEIELWQAIGLAEQRDWNAAEEKFSTTEKMLSGYPEPFLSRYSVLAIESALAAGQDREASEWLDQLENQPHSDGIIGALFYLHGVLYAKAGKAQAAEQAWKQAAHSMDHLYKVRAELALIDLGVANRSLTPAQAADRLEALRFAWRGDDLEIDILHRLGEFYMQSHNVKAGIEVLSRAVQLYPKSPLTPALKQEMSVLFRDVFLGDFGKKISPLDALTLYQQYRDLMPSGADGIAVMRNLSERLVAVDLLTQAGDLLEDLVKTRLDGVERGQVGARLAGIRLLDHKPDAALTALDASSGSYDADLTHQRLLLRAKALADAHKENEALELLQNDTQMSAKILRADISMHAQRWVDAASALIDLVGPPKSDTKLTPEQADWLVNAALALAMAGDQIGLNTLTADYSASIKGMPQNDTFQLLASPESMGQLKDISAAQSRISDVDMFQGFLNQYRKGSQADAAPAAATKVP